MRVAVNYTVEVDDDYRRAINQFYGRKGLASREEVKDWFRQYGESMDDELSLQHDDAEERAESFKRIFEIGGGKR